MEITIIEICLSFVVVLLALVVLRLRRRSIPAYIERLAVLILGKIDNADMVKLAKRKTRPDRASYISTLAILAKNKYGELSNTEANRRMVRRYLLSVMEEKKVRPSHISQILPIALEFVFVPTQTEIDACYIRSSNAVLMRRSEQLDVQHHQ